MTIDMVLGDALEFACAIPTKSLDYVITSPPYPGVKRWGPDWATDEAHEKFLFPVWKQCLRALKDGGTMIINIGNTKHLDNDAITSEFLHDYRMQFVNKIVWKKPVGVGGWPNTMLKTPYSTFYYPYWLWESIIMYSKGKPYQTKVEKLDIEAIRQAKLTGNVWQICGDSEYGKFSAFPERLIDWLVSLYTYPGATVYDPFMGVGTTPVVCAKLGRNFIGTEIDMKIFVEACDRLTKNNIKYAWSIYA